ncbi:FliH/SctL family protein [Konateibacter massiliensis]|uniref:FliH/SctL family protein n=1 Tax=Konateibacter massiliensis TaxID=2002841 RepID=UPI000C14775D|nr:FliH/SctL family protein [Konateibacter massiliensis]
MSNLFKYNTVQCDEEKKIIDYNELIAEKLSKLQNVTKNSEQSEDGLDGDGFKVGLAAREVAITEEAEEIIEEPEVTPEEILEEARANAEQMLQDARKQAEAIKQSAYQEGSKAGYDEGYAQALVDVEVQKQELEAARKKQFQEYQEELNKMEPMLVDAITTVVQNVFKIKFEDNRNMIVHLLKIALGQIQSSKDFVIKVSKNDYPFVVKYKEVLDKSVIGASSLNIMEDISLSKNQCLVETDGGVFDCSLDVQLDNLIKTLKILSQE